LAGCGLQLWLREQLAILKCWNIRSFAQDASLTDIEASKEAFCHCAGRIAPSFWPPVVFICAAGNSVPFRMRKIIFSRLRTPKDFIY
jgi:hypothetical protein